MNFLGLKSDGNTLRPVGVGAIRSHEFLYRGEPPDLIAPFSGVSPDALLDFEFEKRGEWLIARKASLEAHLRCLPANGVSIEIQQPGWAYELRPFDPSSLQGFLPRLKRHSFSFKLGNWGNPSGVELVSGILLSQARSMPDSGILYPAGRFAILDNKVLFQADERSLRVISALLVEIPSLPMKPEAIEADWLKAHLAEQIHKYVLGLLSGDQNPALSHHIRMLRLASRLVAFAGKKLELKLERVLIADRYVYAQKADFMLFAGLRLRPACKIRLEVRNGAQNQYPIHHSGRDPCLGRGGQAGIPGGY